MTPEECLEEVTAMPERPSQVGRKTRAWPYMESVHILREKGYLWREVHAFLEEKTGIMMGDRKALGVHLRAWREQNGK